MARLTDNVLINRVFAYVPGAAGAAGSSAVDGLVSPGFDWRGFNGGCFVGHGAAGGTGGAGSFAVTSSTATGATGVVLLNSSSVIAAGSSATAESFVVDIYRPRVPDTGETFLHGLLTTASSCALGQAIFAIAYEPSNANNSTAAGTVPASTASAGGITGGRLALTSPTT